eukprot:10249395-Alexandrium_andersonii.AAC.1
MAMTPLSAQELRHRRSPRWRGARLAKNATCEERDLARSQPAAAATAAQRARGSAVSARLLRARGFA